MKKLFTLLTLSVLCLLAGCSSGVKQEEYDSVVVENEELKQQLDSLQKNYDSKITDYEKLKSEYDVLDAKRIEDANKELELAAVKAWAVTCFGENSVYFTDNPNYLQCISSNTYSSTASGLSEIYIDFMSTVLALNKLNENEMQINYNKIAMKYPDNNGNTVLEFVLKKKGTKYVMSSITCDAIQATTILPALNDILNK